MECPLCKGEIAEAAKVCKHCKARIIKCPNCLEYTDGNKEKCQVCDSILDSNTPKEKSNNPVINNAEAKIFLMKKKKSFGIALLLNFLWAGWGVFYCESEEGRWIAGVNIVAVIISFFTAFIPTFILFVYSSIICYKQVEIYNAELELNLNKRTNN
jgi:rRNA maturation protein Nop10